MKNVRIELRLSVDVYAGEDVTNDRPVFRAPDADEAADVSRTLACHSNHDARELLADHFTTMMASLAPGITERLVHQLRQKGH